MYIFIRPYCQIEVKMNNNSSIDSIALERKENFRNTRNLLLLSAASVLVFLTVWQLAVMNEWVNPKYLSSPIDVVKTFIVKLTDPKPDGAVIGVHIWTSLKLVLKGYLLAVVVGVPLGFLLAYYYVLDKLISPIFEIMRPIPPIAWIPMSVIWLGIGAKAKTFIIFLAAFVPCVINAYTGIKITNPTYISVGRTCGASRWKIFTTVCIPSALPLAFTGVRVALGNAWSTLVAAELVAAPSGLGYMIQQGRSFVRPDIILVGMFTIGITGAILYWVLGIIEKNTMKWRAKR